MNNIKITADVDTSNPSIPLGLEVWLDDKLLQNIDPVTGPMSLCYELNDDIEQSHRLQFKLKNKLPQHTKIDDNGNIIDDALLTVKNVKIDDIDLGYVFNRFSTYQHNFNGNGDEVTEQFNNCMGCNGTVTFEFSTPYYLWLLENM